MLGLCLILPPMKTYRITMEITVNDPSDQYAFKPEHWVHEAVAQNLEEGEDMIDFKCEEIVRKPPTPEIDIMRLCYGEKPEVYDLLDIHHVAWTLWDRHGRMPKTFEVRDEMDRLEDEEGIVYPHED